MNDLSSADHKALGGQYRKTSLILAAFGATAAVCLLLTWLLPRPELHDPSLGRWSLFVALGGGLGVVTLRRLMLSRPSLRRAGRRGVGAVLGTLSWAAILGGAIAEAIALLGLVTYLLTGETAYSWRLGVIGLLLVIYSFPRRGEWERAVAASEGGDPAVPLIARKGP